jgi:molybdopterin converting factor subunit 1
MTIRVLLFASLRDRSGMNAVDLTIPESATVKTAVAALLEEFPALGAPLNRVMYAVNQEYSDPATVLNQGDELALIPPVSGG